VTACLTPGPATRALYDRLRLRYFMDAEPPLRVPPPSSAIRWLWVSERGPNHAVTHFDPEEDPHTVELALDLRRSWRHLRLTLLHELTHMRDPRAGCGSRGGRPGARWLREQARLAALGAPLL